MKAQVPFVFQLEFQHFCSTSAPAGSSREAESSIDSSNPLSINFREIVNPDSGNSVATAVNSVSGHSDATADANGPVSSAATPLSEILPSPVWSRRSRRHRRVHADADLITLGRVGSSDCACRDCSWSQKTSPDNYSWSCKKSDCVCRDSSWSLKKLAVDYSWSLKNSLKKLAR